MNFVSSGCGRASFVLGGVSFLCHQRCRHRCSERVRHQGPVQAGQPRLCREDPERLQRPVHKTGTEAWTEMCPCWLSSMSTLTIYTTTDIMTKISNLFVVEPGFMQGVIPKGVRCKYKYCIVCIYEHADCFSLAVPPCGGRHLHPLVRPSLEHPARARRENKH